MQNSKSNFAYCSKTHKHSIKYTKRTEALLNGLYTSPYIYKQITRCTTVLYPVTYWTALKYLM